MTLEDVLAAVEASGIRLEACGDHLRFTAPRGAVTPELRDALLRHKRSLLERLAPVYLAGGLTVPRAALELALSLERRGFRQGVNGDGQYTIESTRQSGLLTPTDGIAIARWRQHLAAIVAYEAPPCA